MNAWLILAMAIVLEVAGTTSMKLSDGFSKLMPSILIFVFYGLSFTALTYVLKKLDVSVAYAIWSGVGTVLIAVVGIILFKESLSLMKVGSILLIVIGVVVLNLNGM